MTLPPYCFVLMPFGLKPDPANGPDIDFDHVYSAVIEPGIRAAGMEPIRGDFEKLGGIIHRPMFERLLLCDFAIADLTTGNPNVFYELGVRHAVRPRTTLTIAADEKALPFDVTYLRTLPYRLNERNRFSDEAAKETREKVRDWLIAARDSQRGQPHDHLEIEDFVDSPLFQLLGDYKPPDLAHLKTDTFAERLSRSHKINDEIAAAKASAVRGGKEEALARLDNLRASLGDAGEAEAAALADLMLAYRALSAWDRMIDIVEEMPRPLRRQPMVREQLAMALNRRAEAAEKSGEAARLAGAAEDREKALRLLEEIETAAGPNPETSGLMGRIYKTMWSAAEKAGDGAAGGYLRQAIDAYRRGFQADWRDFYPGINLVTLLHVLGTKAARAEMAEVLPVVRYAVLRRLQQEPDDYWKHATLLELAVLAGNEEAAYEHLANALAAVKEDFQPETTAQNLTFIQSRAANGDTSFISDLIRALQK